MIDQVHVLLVEDNPGDARLTQEMLRRTTRFGYDFVISQVTSLDAAVLQLSTKKFDIVLLDLYLPDSTGLDTLRSLCDLNFQTPIVVLTGSSDYLLAFKAISAGAQDYIPKDECTPQLLTRTIHYAIERNQLEEKLKHLAMHDPLTGLPNRTLLYDRLARALQRSARKAREINEKCKVAIMMVDLDNFKTINDTYGHEAGDLALQQVARRLGSCLRHSDTVSRWGGDEFVILLEGIQDRPDCYSVSQKIYQTLYSPLIPVGEGVSLSASIGISLFPDDASDFDSLLRCADQAMYSSKAQKGQIVFYQDQQTP